MEEQPGWGDWRQWRAPGFRMEAIGNAWTWITRELTVWPVAVLLYVVVAMVFAVPCCLPLILEPPRMPPPGSLDIWALMPWHQHSWAALSIYWGGLLVGGILMYPLQGGILNAALRRLRGEQITAGQIFELRGRYWPLVGVGAIFQLANLVCIAMCILPVLFIAPLFMFAPLIAIDRRLGAWDSIKLSARTVATQYWAALGFCIVVGLVAGLGFLLCGVGMLFTLPIQWLATAIVYDEFFPAAPPEGVGFQV